MLFAEYRACAALGLDIEDYFKKDRYTRMLIVGGYIAESSLSSMRQFDIAQEREMDLERRKRNRR